jgi:rhodanese-related sulfurtransferase
MLPRNSVHALTQRNDIFGSIDMLEPRSRRDLMFKPTLTSTASAVMAAALLVVAGVCGAQMPVADESRLAAEAADQLMKSGKPLVISNDRLQALLADGDPANDPVLISVCAPGDYAKTRIKGSINIPRGAFWKPASLAKLPPKNKPIVAYCYTGTGAVGPAAVLRLMGYDAVQLEWGTMGWTKNDVALGPALRFPETQQDFPVDAKPVTPAVTWARPVIATGKASLAEVLIARGDAVEMADNTVSMTAEAVQGMLTDANPANDPFIVDTRRPEDYTKGHIPGAINVPMANVFEPGNLAKLPLGRRIVVADYNGQTAVGTSYMLSILGYNARGLQYGMMGWSKDDALIAPYKRFPADQKDYPIELGK